MNPAARYLHVRPRGITQWMTQALDAQDPDQQLFRYLLQQPQDTTPVNVVQLSQGTGLARGQVARSLFGLNRHGSIRVSTATPASPREQGHPAVAVQRQLKRLCGDMAGSAVLADPDGLCMASHGMERDDAQGLAAGLAPHRHITTQVMPLYVGRRPCRLHSSSIPVEHEALVGLVRSLHELLAD